MEDVLIVVGIGKVDDLAGVAQTDWAQRLHLLGLKRKQHVFDSCERAAFALRSWSAFGQVVETEHHVLSGNGDRLS